MLATIDWNQIIATAASAVVVLAFLSAVMYRLAKNVINQAIQGAVNPAIEKVTKQQADTLREIVDTMGLMRLDIKTNTADIAYLKGVREGEAQEVQRAIKAQLPTPPPHPPYP